MFVVWTGRGYVVFVIFAASLALAWPLEPLFAPLFRLSGVIPLHETMDANAALLFALAFAIAAVATLPVGRLVLKQPEPWILVDQATGKPQAVNLDTLYRLDTRHWPYVFAAISALLLAAITLLT